MIHQHHRIASAVLALAIAATVVPAALADPQPLAKAEAELAAASRVSTAVRPNPDEQTLTSTSGYVGPCTEVCSGGGYGLGSSPQLVNASSSPSPQSHQSGPALPPQSLDQLIAEASPRPPVAHVTAPRGGFDWGDAGVGAAGMLAVILIAAAGVLTVARRRSHPVNPIARPNPQGQH